MARLQKAGLVGTHDPRDGSGDQKPESNSNTGALSRNPVASVSVVETHSATDHDECSIPRPEASYQQRDPELLALVWLLPTNEKLARKIILESER